MLSIIEKDLKESLKGKVVILGVGNPLRRDDGFGSLLAKRLKDRVAATVIDAQSAPENYLNRLIDESPNTILILDAADFKGAPAQIKLLDPHQALSLNHFTTHNLPLNLLIEFIEHSCQANIFFLALQPKSIDFGETLSSEVKQQVNILEDLLLRLLPR